MTAEAAAMTDNEQLRADIDSRFASLRQQISSLP